MPHPSYHVVPAPQGGWSVKKQGSHRATKHFSNREEAIAWAMLLSKDKSTELYIHNQDGRISDKHSFAPEPFSTEDW